MSSDQATLRRQPGRSCSSFLVRMRIDILLICLNLPPLNSHWRRTNSYLLARISGKHCPWLKKRSCDDTTRAYDHPFGDCRPRMHESLSANPSVCSNFDGLGHQLEIGAVVIVCPPAKVSSLGDHRIVPNDNAVHVIQRRTITNTYVVTQG
jgi:hypothetical protein